MNEKRVSKIDDDMVRVEAILYASGRPVEIERLKNILKTSSRKRVIGLVRELAKRYDARGGALIVEELPEERVALRVREEYEDVARSFSSKPLLKGGPLKTLSYIAYYEPVELREVVSRLGRRAHSHIKTLEEMALITREESDRGVLLRTTRYFSECFRFGAETGDPKQQLRRLFESLRITKLENGDGPNPPLTEEAHGVLASISEDVACHAGGLDGGQSPQGSSSD
jgi:segregation and condensation protein B